MVIEQTVSQQYDLCCFRIMIRAEKRRKGRGERSYDIYSRLLRERVIMLYGPVGIARVHWTLDRILTHTQMTC